MIPLRALLNRIRWDARFGAAQFELGYYDRIEARIIRVPLRAVHVPPGNRFFFQLIDRDGVLHEIPLHRVREVHRNGELIWHRPG